MKCINHNQADAVSTCSVCGSGLCADCSQRFTLMMCEKCLLSHNNSVRNGLIKDLAISLVVFIIAFNIGNNEMDNMSSVFAFAYAIASIHWGWKMMGSAPIFLYFSSKAFGVYIVFKLIFSAIIGGFVMPFMVFQKIREIIAINKTKKDIVAGQA